MSRPRHTDPPAVCRVEILTGPQMLSGPGMAVVDVLRTAVALAAMRTDACHIAWQWTDLQGRAGPRHLPREGRRSAHPNVVVVPGWHARHGPHLDQLVRRAGALRERLHAVHARGGQVVGIYTGVALLGASGLLEQRQASVPWPFAQSIRRGAPTMQLVHDQAMVSSERIWTCDSPALTTELILQVLRERGLRALADSVGSILLHSAQRQRLLPRIEADSRTRMSPGAMERARRWLEEHIDQPYRLQDVARAAAISERSLLRHYRAAHGMTPLQYLHQARATRARMLLETTYLTVEAISEACGYRDAAMFRRVFSEATGQTPSAYREQFRLRPRRRDWGRDWRRNWDVP
jgi:transcriptional regulator GlxA family with amidase domain